MVGLGLNPRRVMLSNWNWTKPSQGNVSKPSQGNVINVCMLGWLVGGWWLGWLSGWLVG